MEKLNLKQLLPFIDEMQEYARLADALQGGGVRKLVVLDAAKPYTLAALYALTTE